MPSLSHSLVWLGRVWSLKRQMAARQRPGRPPGLGCPRNNQIFFGSNRNKPKINLFRLFFGLFRETKKHFFWVCFGLFQFVSVFRTGIETTKTNRIFSKQTEKISKKLSLLGGPRNRKFFFLVQTETNRNSICFSCFSVCFFAKPTIFFGLFQFVSMFRTGIETTEANRTYGMGN